MLAAAIAGVCCVVVGAVLMTSAARSAATTVPVSVGPGGMLVFNPVNVTARQGDTVKWTWGSSGHTTTDTTGLGLWDSKVRSAGATFSHKCMVERRALEGCDVRAGRVARIVAVKATIVAAA